METQQLQDFRNQSISQLLNLKPAVIQLFTTDEITENFTIIIRPDNKTIEVINKLSITLKKVDSEQYYYPLDNLHLTVLGNIPISISVNKIIDAVEKITLDNTYRFILKGLASNQYCSSVNCYPDGFSIS